MNLTTSKTFRQYSAVEGLNHPPVHAAFEHAKPNGDAISPLGLLLNGVVVPPVFTADAATDLLTTIGHGLVADTPVRFSSDDTLPTGLEVDTTYYVIASGLTADAFKVSGAIGGAALDITDAGTGAHSWSRYLTADEQAEIDQWFREHNDIKVVLPAAILARDAWLAYEINPRHKAWLIDDYLQRHHQWIWRSADHADAAQGATPPSASDIGEIPDPPPPTPIERSPN